MIVFCAQQLFAVWLGQLRLTGESLPVKYTGRQGFSNFNESPGHPAPRCCCWSVDHTVSSKVPPDLDLPLRLVTFAFKKSSGDGLGGGGNAGCGSEDLTLPCLPHLAAT